MTPDEIIAKAENLQTFYDPTTSIHTMLGELIDLARNQQARIAELEALAEA